MHEQWRRYCTSQWGWCTPLSEHVSCVAFTFKTIEWVEQWIHIKFCIKVEHSSAETIHMIQKATAMGNWWLAASSQQCTHSFIMSHAEFFVKHQITQVTQLPYRPAWAPCDFWLFPKLKSPWKGKRFQTVNEIQEKMTGQLMATGGTVGGPKVPIWKEWSVIVPWTMFLVSSLRNVSIFQITWLDTFWTDLYTN